MSYQVENNTDGAGGRGQDRGRTWTPIHLIHILQPFSVAITFLAAKNDNHHKENTGPASEKTNRVALVAICASERRKVVHHMTVQYQGAGKHHLF